MMKAEFEGMIKGSVTAEDYKVIELVYMYYGEQLTKERAVDLYHIFGSRIFYDMAPRARKIADLEDAVRLCQAKVADAQNELRAARLNNEYK